MQRHDHKTMAHHYLGAALWTAELDDSDAGDFDNESVGFARGVCYAFFSANMADLADMTPEQAGHDLWLTRNGHGAGFWDRGLGEVGDRLTTAAAKLGEAHCYIDDDDATVYIEG